MRNFPAAVLVLGATLLACGSSGDDGSDGGLADLDASADAAGGGVLIVLETTLGEMTLELDVSTTPNTSANFLRYLDEGFYDGTLIHRVEDDWVIQGGGYTSGLVPTTPSAPIDLEIGALSHVHGAISMARTSDPNSATSQWFIVDWPTSGTPPQPAQLDGDYAVFGVMTDGLAVLEAITKVPVHDEGALQNVPNSELVITRGYRKP